MPERLTLNLPESSGISNVEAHNRPVELPSGFAQRPELADIELEMHIPYSAGQATTDAFRSRPAESPLSLWYQRNDGPWIPQGLTSGQDSARVSPIGSSLRGNPLAFPGHRNSIVPSECDTVPPGVIPSDSGYGSYHPRHSVANGSICDESFDRSQETPSLIGPNINDVAFQSFSQKDDIAQGNTWSHSQGYASERQFAINPTLRCDTCGKELKTESERKKHEQRHTKPHKCPIGECTRHKEGFSTTNDLDRHIRSVHPTEKAAGNRYQCTLGLCKNKGKIWPRADNFKAHLKRVHREDPSDESLQRFVYSANTHPPPPQDLSVVMGEEAHPGLFHYGTLATEQSGYPAMLWAYPQSSTFALHSEPSITEQPDRAHMEETSTLPAQPGNNSPLHMPNTNPESVVHGNGDDMFSNTHNLEVKSKQVQHRQDQSDAIELGQLEQQAMNHCSGHPTDAKQSPQRHNGTNRPNEPETCLNGPSSGIYVMKGKNEHPSKEVYEPSGACVEPESRKATETTSIAVDLTSQSDVKRFLETLRVRGLLEELRHQMNEHPRDLEEIGRESMSGSNREHTHVCTKCSKQFPRKCELKKHEKRHQKPYGCTFQGCNKRFGSKNDWKRHENSQHFMLELWRCEEKQKDNPTATCGKNIQRKESFRHHLENHHQIKDPKVLEFKQEKCRLGRNCETRFWCGFCEATVEIREKGIKAWTERFNHIDDHFSGRNNQEPREIGDWKNVDPAHPREDSPILDSDDSSDSNTSPPLEPSASMKKRKSSTRSSKSKRKRSDGPAEGGSKKVKQASRSALYHCCGCSDIFPVMSRQCISCEHVLCNNCTYSLENAGSS
ncbi:hypothetical protein F4775DRAFT_582170 [Biscogniauxia sp. FL1348]|nr:hypothetical protein F4775DRAFT_582170 [Biscogniauxia sp. FL1348]